MGSMRGSNALTKTVAQLLIDDHAQLSSQTSERTASRRSPLGYADIPDPVTAASQHRPPAVGITST
jgi:hypothetical protein